MRRWGLTVLMLTAIIGGVGTPAGAAASEDHNERRDWLKKFDDNNDGRGKGKEIRNFRDQHPKKFEELLKWCDRALAKPSKFDVSFPKGEKAKKFKCKKSKVDAPYLRAWVKLGKPEPKPEPIHPSNPDYGKDKDADAGKGKGKKD